MACLDAERVDKYLDDVAKRYLKRIEQGLTLRDEEQFRRFSQNLQTIRNYVAGMVNDHSGS